MEAGISKYVSLWVSECENVEMNYRNDFEIYPTLLAGGSGTRLWPLSRKSYPNNFRSLLAIKRSFKIVRHWSLHQNVVNLSLI